ncbi:FliG C-terminal domain-containing protein [Parasphingorhabdus sp. JC815]|uniref:flagellar motor switch protein FliG n=1 Tax=Parasphingorhabdus sp. JC815 TaxID=3232140 RepID=UPI00345B3642
MAEAALKDRNSEEGGNQLELISGRQTAAILMLLFDDDEAARILERLEPEEAERLGEAMFSVADVDSVQIEGSLNRFLELVKTQSTLAYKSDEKVGRVFRQALGTPRAENMMNRFAPKRPSNIASLLKWVPAKDIAALVENEPPQIAAVLISFMTPEAAAQMLQLVSPQLQQELIYRVATLGPVSAHALAQIHSLLEDNGPTAEEIVPPMEIGGVMDSASIVNNLPKQMGQMILKSVTKRNRQIGRQIEDEMFVFTDLLLLSKKDIGTVVRKVDAAILVPALRGASAEMKTKIFESMSQRAAETIQDDMEDAPPQPMEEVIAAQKAVIEIAKMMIDNGEISMSAGGADYV